MRKLKNNSTMQFYFSKTETIIEESTTGEVDLSKLTPDEQFELVEKLIDLISDNDVGSLVIDNDRVGNFILKEHIYIGHRMGIKKQLNTILTELEEDELEAELDIIYKKYIPE